MTEGIFLFLLLIKMSNNKLLCNLVHLFIYIKQLYYCLFYCTISNEAFHELAFFDTCGPP